jgi:group I intron endonuclease
MNSAIYSITSPSGKQYIGSSKSAWKRWKWHRRDLMANRHPNYKLQRAADKYGIDNLRFSILLFCRSEDLVFYEQLAMDAFKPAYNIAPVTGSTVGFEMPERIRIKMRWSHIGKRLTPEHAAAIGRAHKGKIINAEGRAKMSIAAKRRDRSKGYSSKHRAAIQAGLKAFWDERRRAGLPLMHPRERR